MYLVATANKNVCQRVTYAKFIHGNDKPYCCPQENDGCCPPIPVDTIPNNDPDILFPCFPLCYTDADCKQGQKCCGTCPPRCMPVVIP